MCACSSSRTASPARCAQAQPASTSSALTAAATSWAASRTSRGARRRGRASLLEFPWARYWQWSAARPSSTRSTRSGATGASPRLCAKRFAQRRGDAPVAPDLVDRVDDGRAALHCQYLAHGNSSKLALPLRRAPRLVRLAAQEVAAAVSALEVEAGCAWAHLAGEAVRDELQAHIVLGRFAVRVATRRGLAPHLGGWLFHQKAEAGFLPACGCNAMI